MWRGLLLRYNPAQCELALISFAPNQIVWQGVKTDKDMNLRFDKNWFYLFISLFLLECCIAFFVHDHFIRPFVGDVLVVWLVFAFVRAFVAGGENWHIAVGVFVFAVLVEAGQYFDLVSLLGLQESSMARVVIGSVFDWKDILAYGVGTMGIFLGIHFKTC
jgi:hypothetical protein